MSGQSSCMAGGQCMKCKQFARYRFIKNHAWHGVCTSANATDLARLAPTTVWLTSSAATSSRVAAEDRKRVSMALCAV